jgi:hypothetical protein
MVSIPLVEMLKNRGVRQGLGQTSNSVKMAALILLPLIGPWFAMNIFFREYSDIGTPIVFGGWMAVIIIYYYAKKASASEYWAFPQAGWQFPDGQQMRFDLCVPPNRGEGMNGWEPVTVNEKPVIYTDGSHLVKVAFKDRMFYQDPKRDIPDIFNEAFWKLPGSWQDSFDFNGFGEFFYEGLFITHTKSENVEVTVIDWDERGGSRIPVCAVTSCSFYHKQIRKFEGKILPKPIMSKIEAKEAVIADLKKRNGRLSTRNDYLEQEAERHDREEPAIIKERLDREKDKILEEYSDVMDIKQPLSKRIWRNMKYLAYFGVAALIFLGVLKLLGML